MRMSSFFNLIVCLARAEFGTGVIKQYIKSQPLNDTKVTHTITTKSFKMLFTCIYFMKILNCIHTSDFGLSKGEKCRNKFNSKSRKQDSRF